MAEFRENIEYPLPLIGPESIGTMNADMAIEGTDEYILGAERRLEVDNPGLFSLVAQFALDSDWDDRQLTAARESMVLTHELLRRQAEADAMKKNFLDPES